MSDARRLIWIDEFFHQSHAELSWSGGFGGRFSLELVFADADDDVTLRRWDGPLGPEGLASMSAPVRECHAVLAELINQHRHEGLMQYEGETFERDTDDPPWAPTPGTDGAFHAVLAELEGQRGYPERTSLIPADWSPDVITLILPRPDAFALVWPDGSEILAIPRTDRRSRLRRRLRLRPYAMPHAIPDRTRLPGHHGRISDSEAVLLPPDYHYEFRGAPLSWLGPPTAR